MFYSNVVIIVSLSTIWICCFLMGVQPHGFRWRRLRRTEPEKAKLYFKSWLFWFFAFMVLGLMSDPLRLSESVQIGMSVAMAVVSFVSFFLVGDVPGAT